MPATTYIVAGWAPVSEGATGEPVWDVVASYLRDVKVGEEKITGKIDRLVIKPESDENKLVEGRVFRTNNVEIQGNAKSIKEVLDDNDVPFDGLPPPGVMEKYGPVLLMTALVFLVFFIMIRRLGGTGSAMAFGRSRATTPKIAHRTRKLTRISTRMRAFARRRFHTSFR